MNRIKQARIAAGMTIADLADRVGVSGAQVSRWENGKSNLSITRLQILATELGCNLSDLLDPAVYNAPYTVPPPNAALIKMEGASEQRMREDLPVYGTALGAPIIIDHEAVEQTTLNTGEVVQYAKRPVILEGRADAYGLYVQGSSMEPVHLAGDLVLAETKRPARVGDDVIVYLRPKDESDDGERARSVLIKRLVRRTASHIELEQFNPAMTFRLPTEEVLRIDRTLRLADLIA